MNTTTRTELRNGTADLNTSIASLAEKAAQMTDAELSLLIRIMDMVTGNTARRQFVMNYTGRMKDLPEILETI